MKQNLRFWNLFLTAALLISGLALPLQSAEANNTVQTLPFSQNWSNTGLIAYTDNWDNVPGIVGYRGRRHAGVIDMDRVDGHDPRDFFEPLVPVRGELLQGEVVRDDDPR